MTTTSNIHPRRRRDGATKRSAARSTRPQLPRRKWSARSARRTEGGRADHVRSIREKIRRRLRHCRFHSRRRLFRSTKRSIGQPPPGRTPDRLLGALPITDTECDSLVVAEVELAQIPLQMLLANVVINAIDAAL